MKSREDALAFCLSLPESYCDTPFRDANWTLARHRANRKAFALVFERSGHIWINVKAAPGWRDFWRQSHASVIAAYHMNKEHWNSLILDGSIPAADIRQMIEDSYHLTLPKTKTR
ncbi:MAG: MmcQ/YjbR family DNA-binding protein [Neisseria sp.]|nr:MmcQ/YjbR family DNA-binding protein [Neisseria sp.]